MRYVATLLAIFFAWCLYCLLMAMANETIWSTASDTWGWGAILGVCSVALLLFVHLQLALTWAWCEWTEES